MIPFAMQIIIICARLVTVVWIYLNSTDFFDVTLLTFVLLYVIVCVQYLWKTLNIWSLAVLIKDMWVIACKLMQVLCIQKQLLYDYCRKWFSSTLRHTLCDLEYVQTSIACAHSRNHTMIILWHVQVDIQLLNCY